MKRAVFVIVGLIVIGGVGWYLGAPLLFDQQVEEAFPTSAAQQPTEATAASAEPTDDPDMLATAQSVDAGTPMADDPMPEAPPAAEPVAVKSGSFIEIDRVHAGEGTATLYELPEGEQLVRFEAFRVTNGPDLHVLLAAAPDPRTRADLGDNYIDLGMLKGNVGPQNYEVPAGTDLSAYNSIVIYCMPFHVVFSVATLNGG